MKEIKPPNPFKDESRGKYRIFLGGSIEMGRADNWQSRVVNKFMNKKNLVFLNPRRLDWDSSWQQDPAPGTKFHEQVTWEMDAQEQSDLIVYYFDPDTISPVTLLELGAFGISSKHLHGQNVVVCCPDGYFRKGNVVMFCQRYGIKCTDTFDDMIAAINDYTAFVD